MNSPSANEIDKPNDVSNNDLSTLINNNSTIDNIRNARSVSIDF